MKKSIGSGRGSVYNILLKALQSGDKYGYEICKEVEEKTNGSYILKQASLYSGLKRLEAQGDITSYWRDSALGGRRHYYSLTEKGKERINRSNFSWTDAREDIVGSLFEKSQLDSEIESVTNDINSLKETATAHDDIQKNIDYIIENTKDLSNMEDDDKEDLKEENLENNNDEEQETEIAENVSSTFDAEQNTYNPLESDDLFSMFNNLNGESEQNSALSSQEAQSETDNNEALEQEQNVENVIENQKDNKALNVEQNVEDDNEYYKNDQQDLFSFAKYNEAQNENYADENNNEASEEPAEKDSFEDIMQNFKTVENEKDLEKTNTEDVNQENDAFYGSSANEENSIEQDISEIDKDDKNQVLDDEYVDQYADSLQSNNNYEETTEQTDELFSVDEIENLAKDEVDSMQNESENFAQQDAKFEILKNAESNVLDEYKKQHVSYNRFTDSIQTEKPDDTFSSLFEEFSANENLNNELDLTSIEDQTKNDIQNDENEISQEIVKEENNAIETEKTESETHNNQTAFKTFDYKDIFGDLMSTSDDRINDHKVNQTTNVVNNTENLAENKAEISSFDNQKPFEFESATSTQTENRQEFKDDLPRLDSDLQDINRTLFIKEKTNETNAYKSDNDFEKYDQNPFRTSDENPFEKYDTYQELDFENSNKNANTKEYNQNNYQQKTDNLSFDKKYANAYNRFEVPDYEVRYFKKSNPKNTQSKFISINKLNLVVSFILCVMMCIATTLTLVFAGKNGLSAFQTVVYVLSYIVSILVLLFNFLKYISNKNKKTHSLNKNETMINIFVAIFVAILSIAINLFAGMSFNNIAKFLGSFIIPICYSVVLLVKFPLKRFLSKFANFYN